MDSRLFQLNELAAAENIIDYQTRIGRAVEQHADDADFPQPAASGITREELTDYLFDYQAILDLGGSPRQRYTACGVLMILPVLVLSAVPESLRPFGQWAILGAVAVGLLLFLVYLAALKAVAASRLSRLKREQPQCAAYAEKVEEFLKK